MVQMIIFSPLSTISLAQYFTSPLVFYSAVDGCFSPVCVHAQIFLHSHFDSMLHALFGIDETCLHQRFPAPWPSSFFNQLIYYSLQLFFQNPTTHSKQPPTTTNMAKMNLKFILTPDKDSNNGGNSNESRYSDGPRPESSPLSLEYIAPRTSDSSRVSTPPSRPSRHFESSSSHMSLQDPHSMTSPNPPRNSSRDQASTSRFKGKKCKSPSSPSALRSPSGEVKPHVCRACDRSFYKLEQLKRHDRLVHLNLRPYICSTCDLSFGTKQNMQVHLTTRKHQHRLETIQASRRSAHGSSSRQHP